MRLTPLAFAALVAGCATGGAGGAAPPGTPKGVSFGGGDGLSCASRVIIRGAAGESDGIAAEYAWLHARYPDFKLQLQSLTRCGEAPADQMSIKTSDGRSVDVTFDISDFFGKGFK